MVGRRHFQSFAGSAELAAKERYGTGRKMRLRYHTGLLRTLGKRDQLFAGLGGAVEIAPHLMKCPGEHQHGEAESRFAELATEFERAPSGLSDFGRPI